MVYTKYYPCDLCLCVVGDLPVHKRSNRHEKMLMLFYALEHAKSEFRKEKITALIEKERARRKSKRDYYDEKRKIIEKERYRESRKGKSRTREPPIETCVLISRKIITRPDGETETQEEWKEVTNRFGKPCK
jgi:DNA invertase Pin-like site-specific DNA recombinase